MTHETNRSLCFNIAKANNIEESILNGVLHGRIYKSPMTAKAVKGGAIYNCYDVIVNHAKRTVGLISYSSFNKKNPDYMVAVLPFKDIKMKAFTPEDIFNHEAIASNAVYTKDALEAINILGNDLVSASAA